MSQRMWSMVDLFISLCDVSTELIWQCGLVQMVESANLHSRKAIKFWEPCNNRRGYWSCSPAAEQPARHTYGLHLWTAYTSKGLGTQKSCHMAAGTCRSIPQAQGHQR